MTAPRLRVIPASQATITVTRRGSALPLFTDAGLSVPVTQPVTITAATTWYVGSPGRADVVAVASDGSPLAAVMTQLEVDAVASVQLPVPTGPVRADTWDAHTVMVSGADNSPVPLTVPEGTMVGRAVGGGVAALTAAQARALLAPVTFDGVPEPTIVAHRFGNEVGPEETISAARLSVSVGADALDCDLRLLGDGHLALSHDDTVDRVTNGTGNVNTHTIRSWSSLVVDSATLTGDSDWPTEAPPTWEQVLREFGGRVLISAQAYDASALAPAADMVADLGVPTRSVEFQTNSLVVLAQIHALGHPANYVSGTLPDAGEWAAIAAAAPGCTVGVDYTALTSEGVAAGHAVGLKVHAWAPKRHRQVDALLAMGVDGVNTDNPGYVRGTLPTRLTDLFSAQHRTPWHFRQSGTNGAFISPNIYGWASTTATVDYQTVGYMAPSDGSSTIFQFDLKHAAGDAKVWLGKSDDFDNNAAGRTGCDGYLLTVTSAGKIRMEEYVNGSRTQWLAYDVVVTGYVVGDGNFRTWQFLVTPTQIGWKYVPSGQTASYASSLTRPIRYLSIGQAAGQCQYRALSFT